jgi:hypothetical protein
VTKRAIVGTLWGESSGIESITGVVEAPTVTPTARRYTS